MKIIWKRYSPDHKQCILIDRIIGSENCSGKKIPRLGTVVRVRVPFRGPNYTYCELEKGETYGEAS